MVNQALETLLRNPDFTNRQNSAARIFNGPRVFVENGIITPATDFWRGTAGLSENQITPLVDGDSNLLFRLNPEEIEQALKEDHDSFKRYMHKILGEAYVPVQPTLNAIAKTDGGLNQHELEIHIERGVAEPSVAFADRFSYSETEKNVLYLTAVLHDLAQIFGRSNHGIKLYELAKRLLPERAFNSDFWQAILVDAMTHDESVGVMLAMSAYALTANQGLEAFFELYGQLSSKNASIIRKHDKADAVNPTRLMNGVELTTKHLEDDEHFLVSAFLTPQETITDRTVTLSFQFSRASNEILRLTQPKLIGESKQHPEGKIISTEDMKKEYKKGKDFFTQITEKFWQSQRDRMFLYMIDTFRLMPEVEEVIIEHYERTGTQPDQQKVLRKIFTRQEVMIYCAQRQQRERKLQ